MEDTINEIVFSPSGGVKRIHYEFTDTYKCQYSNVTMQAPDWINVNEDSDNQIYHLSVGASTNKRQGEIKFYLDNEVCNVVNALQNYDCACTDFTFNQSLYTVSKLGADVGTILGTFITDKDCDKNVRATLTNGANVYDLLYDNGNVKLKRAIEPNTGKKKTLFFDIYYDDIEEPCINSSLTQEGELICDCSDVEVYDIKSEFSKTGETEGTVIARYSVDSICDKSIIAYIRGGSFTSQTPLECVNGEIKLINSIPINSGDIITYKLTVQYDTFRCFQEEINQEGIGCDCTSGVVITAHITNITPRGLNVGDIIGKYTTNIGCNIRYVRGLIFEGNSTVGIPLSCESGYIRLTQKIDYNVSRENKTFIVKIYYGSSSDECQSFNITQDWLLCECSSMDFFVGGLKNTFSIENGSEGIEVEVATGNTLDCGSLSATCLSNILDGGNIRTVYDEETKTYHYYAKVLPSDSGSRSASIRFYFKGKDSSEYEECEKKITLLQTNDYSYCVDVYPVFDYDDDEIVLNVTQFGKTRFKAVDFSPRNPTYHKYLIESSASWLGFDLVEDSTNGDELFFVIERNYDDNPRIGTVTIQQWLDAEVVEDGGIETLKGGYMCMETVITVNQNAYEDVTCDTDDLYYYLKNREFEINYEERNDWSMFAPFQTHSDSISAETVDENGYPYTYDWIEISSIVKQDEYSDKYGDGTFGNQFKVNFNISENVGINRTSYIKIYSVVNGVKCDDNNLLFSLSQRENECKYCRKDAIAVHPSSLNGKGGRVNAADYYIASDNCGRLSATTTDSWLSIDTKDRKYIYVDFSKNNTDEPRTGTIKVYIANVDGSYRYDEECYKEVVFTQDVFIDECSACTINKVSVSNIGKVSSEGGNSIIASYGIYSDECGWLSSYTISDDSSWLTSYHGSDTYLRCEYTKNESIEERSGIIRLYISKSKTDSTNKYGDACYKDVTITQLPTPCDCSLYTLSEIQTEGYESEIIMHSGMSEAERTHSIGYVSGLIPYNGYCLKLVASSTHNEIDSVWFEESTDGYILKLRTKDMDIDSKHDIAIDVKLMDGDEQCAWIVFTNVSVNPPTS